MDSKDGLVAPVWSDSGAWLNTVTVNIANTRPIEPGSLRDWLHGEIARLAEVFGVLPEVSQEARICKPSDPNAKPALPALTRVGGNKRGPGWCDQEGV